MEQIPTVEGLRAAIGFWPYRGLEFKYGDKIVVGQKLTTAEGQEVKPDYRCHYRVAVSAVGLLHPFVDDLISGKRSQFVLQTAAGTTVWTVQSPTPSFVH